jgi:hypothetical protein
MKRIFLPILALSLFTGSNVFADDCWAYDEAEQSAFHTAGILFDAAGTLENKVTLAARNGICEGMLKAKALGCVLSQEQTLQLKSATLEYLRNYAKEQKEYRSTIDRVIGSVEVDIPRNCFIRL